MDVDIGQTRSVILECRGKIGIVNDAENCETPSRSGKAILTSLYNSRLTAVVRMDLRACRPGRLRAKS